MRLDLTSSQTCSLMFARHEAQSAISFWEIALRWFGRLALIALFTLPGCMSAPPVNAEIVAHPDKKGTQIEYFMRKPAGVGPWPTIIFLHGHQPILSRVGGRAFVDWGVLDRFAKKGYLAVSVSLPGFGGSSGPADFAGPFTQHAVEAVLAKLVAEQKAAPDKVVIEGISLGAVTGALIASHDKPIAGLVLISGLYDMPTFLAHPKSAAAMSVKAAAIEQTGGGDDALRARSALFLASRNKANTLILSGGKDDRTDANQAVLYADAINATGGHARAHIYPQYGHAIPVQVRDAEIDAFIDATLNR
jgi:dipeptidyl aminopeptidase/acylaminoacyl peptidase